MHTETLGGRGSAKPCLFALTAAVVLGLIAPTAAQAWTVTVHVHGAGTVQEVTNRLGGSRAAMNCTVGPGEKSNTSVTDCVGGTPGGVYNSGDVVRLQPSLSVAAANRGWVFDHWTDSSASGQINCDPQETTGDFSSPLYCEFQIFQNLETTLVFKDISGPQDTAIFGGPTGTTKQTTATFTAFSTSDPDATYQCRLDPPGTTGSYAFCPSSGASFSNLTQNGTWALYVRGVDPSGNFDTTPASRTWTVDTVAPDTVIDDGPDGPTNDSTPTFTYHSTEASSSLSCTIDGTTSACNSGTFTPSSALSEGQHTFSVTATDGAGNTDQSAATHTFTVDTQSPDTTIDDGPDGPTNDPTPTFTYHSTEVNSSFTCSFDGGSAAPCNGGSFTPAVALGNGQHTFAVYASDTASNADQSAATRTFTVDTQAPTASITQHPKATMKTKRRRVKVTFSFSSSEPGTFECQLDGKDPATTCASPKSFRVGKGSHTVSITAIDAAGNRSSPATFAFKVKRKH